MNLSTQSLCKKFGAFTALEDVTVHFAAGSMHAILGENGAGKTTLLKTLFGMHQPSSGDILLDDEKIKWKSPREAILRGLGMVHQHFSLVPTLSAIDNLILGAEPCSPWGAIDRTTAMRTISGKILDEELLVPWDLKVEQLSVGQKQRLEILKLLYRDAQILFLDEPTAVLTPHEIEGLFRNLKLLRSQGRTIIVITHKISEVIQHCDSYSVLRQGKLVATGRVKDTTSEELVEKMIGRKPKAMQKERTPPGNNAVLKVSSLSENTQEATRFGKLDLQVNAGEILGIAGVDGSGQAHFVESIFGLRDFVGELSVFGKTIEFAGSPVARNSGVGLVPDDRLEAGLWGDESCYHNLIVGIENRFAKYGFLNENEITATTQKWADTFDVRTQSLHNPANSLSGGNQQKLIFAREVAGRDPRLLICHQPSRGVDLGAIELIHQKMLELRIAGVGILLISLDLDELMTLSDRIVVFYQGTTLKTFARVEFDRMKIGAAMLGISDAP